MSNETCALGDPTVTMVASVQTQPITRTSNIFLENIVLCFRLWGISNFDLLVGSATSGGGTIVAALYITSPHLYSAEQQTNRRGLPKRSRNPGGC